MEREGQYSIFDAVPKRKPCEYRFQRYIGQWVRDSHGVHQIAEIEHYYTIYTDRMVGTPHDMRPLEEE